MVDGVPHTVVGITPDDFRGHFHFFQSPPSLLFVPLERHPRLRQEPSLRNDRTADWVRIHGRLAPGVSLTQANGLVVVGRGDAGEPVPRDEPVQGGRRGAVRVAGCRWPSGVVARVQRPLEPGGSGAADRVREHLGHDADARRHASARAVDSRRARRRPAGPRRSICSSKRSCWRVPPARSVRACCSVFPRCIGWWMGAPVPPEVDFDAAGALVAAGLCLVVSVLFGLLPALRFSRPSLLPALQENAGRGGTQTDSRPSPRRHGADRHRRAVSRDERRDDRSRADRRLRIAARWSGWRAHPRVGQAARRRVHPVSRRRPQAGGRRALGRDRRRDAH